MSGGGAFNIASQQAGAIYQAAGDQRIAHGGGTLAVHRLSAVADLRAAIEAASLPEPARHDATSEVEAIESELEEPAPDRGRIAAGVERLTETLREAGALASAGEALAGPLRSLASWAGAAGVAALRLLA